MDSPHSAAEQVPSVRSAFSCSPAPMKMDARGEPPMPISAANAEISVITGKGDTHAGQRKRAPRPDLADIDAVDDVCTAD